MRLVQVSFVIALCGLLTAVGCGKSTTSEYATTEAGTAKAERGEQPQAAAPKVAPAKVEGSDDKKTQAPGQAIKTPTSETGEGEVVPPATEPAPAEAAVDGPKPWLNKPPRLQVVDQGQGISGLLSSCKLHLSGGNARWAEAACHHALNKGLKKGYRDMPGLFYRLGVVYERRGKRADAKACFQEALKRDPAHGPSKKRLERIEKKG